MLNNGLFLRKEKVKAIAPTSCSWGGKDVLILELSSVCSLRVRVLDEKQNVLSVYQRYTSVI